MEEEKRKAYSEVVEILKLIENEEKIEKIPFEVIQLIKANSDPTYKPNISKDIPLEEQNLRNETYSILGWIASKYWEEDVGVNQEISDANTQTIIEEKAEENISKVEEIAENQERKVNVYNDIEPECLEGSNLPVLVSEMSWYERLKITVIRWFKKIFRINVENREEGTNE